MSFRRSQREASRPRAESFVEDTKASEKGNLEPNELQSRDR